MGYFVLEKDDTVEARLEACIANIKLYLEANGTCSYLLTDFAKNQLESVIEEITTNSSDVNLTSSNK